MLRYTNYRGLSVSLVENSWVKLYIAPMHGGRILQLELDGYGFFYVNPHPEGSWLNFGGEKIWPAPQGWSSSDKWPGPPDPVLDGGPYSITELDAGTGEDWVKLTSPFDNYTGLQITKEIHLSEISSEVVVKASFQNLGNHTVRWSVWPVCQMNTPFESPENRYQIICPVNPDSKFENGFKVIHGLANNPQNTFDSFGNLVVSYQYLVCKVGLDSNAGWVAWLDNVTGKVFVYKFDFDSQKVYPQNCSVEIWTTGRGLTYSRQLNVHKDDRSVNPPYMEAELLSPMHEMRPGENALFEYRMATSTIPANSGIKEVNKYAVIASPLKKEIIESSIAIAGKFGVFTNGTVKLKVNGTYLSEMRVSPSEGVNIDFNIENGLFQKESTFLISLDLFDADGHFLGIIDKN